MVIVLILWTVADMLQVYGYLLEVRKDRGTFKSVHKYMLRPYGGRYLLKPRL